jgi:hypothetical protein
MVQGPNNSLWEYWASTGGQWQGPLGVGGPGSTESSPAVAFGSTGLPVVAVQGPAHALWLYWEGSGGQWNGPLAIGQVGTTYSSPAISVGSSGLPTIAVEGPANTLWIYQEQAVGGSWTTTKGVGTVGSTNSSPAIAAGPAGLPDVLVQGPSNTLWEYWEGSDGQWQGPLGVGGPGSTNSSPAIAFGPTGLPLAVVQGPGNALWAYWEIADGQWQGPLGVGTPGSSNSSPAIAVGPAGLPDVLTQGPSDSLWEYWAGANGQWQGPLGLGSPGSDNASLDPGGGNVPAPSSAIGNAAASIATSQDGVGDTPASTSFGFDCNPYTAILYPAMRSSACGIDPTFGIEDANEEWCADFAKFVWLSAGLSTSTGTLNPGAASFYTWGAQDGEAMPVDSGSPQVGDAIVFYPPGSVGGGYADHVGIVSAVNPDGTINVVNGDFTNATNIGVETDDDVLPGPFAAAIWSSGEQWVYVSP